MEVHEMTESRDEQVPTAVSVGDGSLGGPGIGGSLLGPEAGVIHDPVGDDIAAPITTDPGEGSTAGEPTDDTAALHELDPATDGRSGDADAR
jgi:hypothetical protein